jgi:hypothetical protein
MRFGGRVEDQREDSVLEVREEVRKNVLLFSRALRKQTIPEKIQKVCNLTFV